MKTISVTVQLLVLLVNPNLIAQNNTNLGTGTHTYGTNNTTIGYFSGKLDGGSPSEVNSTNATYLGYKSGYNFVGGQFNTFIGAESGGFTSSSQKLISNNTFVGYRSGYSNRTGTGQNVFLGANAGYTLISGSGNIFIGYNAGYSETGSNKLYIDNSNTATPLIYGDLASDKVGINSLPNTTHTLTVGGTIHATGIYVNGQSLSDAGFEFWTKSGTNVWNNTGNVGIGTPLTQNPNNYKLAVKGKLGAQEVQIENNSLTWSDFVFNDDYKLMSLEELESYIKANKHLPEIPTAQEVKENGILLGEMNAKLLQKIEELTLHLIELKKEVETLKKSSNK